MNRNYYKYMMLDDKNKEFVARKMSHEKPPSSLDVRLKELSKTSKNIEDAKDLIDHTILSKKSKSLNSNNRN